jgi:hypothetical protein
VGNKSINIYGAATVDRTLPQLKICRWPKKEKEDLCDTARENALAQGRFSLVRTLSEAENDSDTEHDSKITSILGKD